MPGENTDTEVFSQSFDIWRNTMPILTYLIQKRSLSASYTLRMNDRVTEAAGKQCIGKRGGSYTMSHAMLLSPKLWKYVHMHTFAKLCCGDVKG